MKKYKEIILGIVLVISCVVSYQMGSISSLRDNESTKVAKLSYDSKLPELDLKNKKMNLRKFIESNKSEYKVVFYLSSKCSACNRQLDAAKSYNTVLERDKFSFFVLWEDKIVRDNYNKYGIKEKNVVCLKDNRLAIGTPAVIILDKKNNIVFYTDDTEIAVDKLISLSDHNKMIERLNKYYVGNDETKPTLVYFKMSGCPDCKAIEPILKKEDIQKKYNIKCVYTEKSYGAEKEVDINDIQAKLYGIDWYPSFVLIKKNATGYKYKVIGKMTKDEIVDELRLF